MPIDKPEPDFRTLFEAIPGLYLALDLDFRVIAISHELIHVSKRTREEIVGKNLFDAFPENGESPLPAVSLCTKKSFDAVVANHVGSSMPVQRMERYRTDSGKNSRYETYWKVDHSPVFDWTGSLSCIIQKIEDVTASVLLEISNAQRTDLITSLNDVDPRNHDRIVTTSMERTHTEQAITELRDREEELAALFDAIPTPIFIAHDPEGKHITGNHAANEMLRLDQGSEISMAAPESMKPKHFKVIQNGREMNPLDLPTQRAARGETVKNLEYSLHFDDGRITEISAFAQPLYDDKGRSRGAVTALFDLTERKKGETQLRLLETCINRLNDMVIITNAAPIDKPGPVILFVNDAYVKLTGYSREEIVGKVPRIFHESAEVHESIVPLRNAVKDWKTIRTEILKPKKNGELVWLDVDIIPVVDDRGVFTHWVGVERDITERKRAEEALKAREAQLLSFVQNAPAAIAMFDREMIYLAVSETWLKSFGRRNSNLIGRCHYDVSPDLPTQWKEAHCRAMGGESLSNDEDRWVQADGTILWVRWTIKPWVDAKGLIGGIMIMSENITARKAAEESLKQSEARLSTILDTAADAIITHDQNGMIHSVNLAAQKMFGYSRDELVGHSARFLISEPYEHTYEMYVARSRRDLRNHRERVAQEIEGRRKDGTNFPAELTVSQVGDLSLYTAVIRDVTCRKELEREVVEVASLEQARIGQDLHDTVSQELTALRMMTQDLSEILTTEPSHAIKLVERIGTALKRTQREVRAVMQGLLPVAVEANGLMASLSDLAQRISEDHKIACVFDCRHPVLVQENLVALHLYLIAQESVHNAIKHASPSQIRITLKDAPTLELTIRDDGVGIASAENLSHDGLGMRIMRYRAAIIGAWLSIEPTTPKGTLVTCRISREHDRMSWEGADD